VATVLATFQDQLVFYLTSTDVLARFATDPSKTRCRSGGLVLKGSVVHPSSASSEIEFFVGYEGRPSRPLSRRLLFFVTQLAAPGVGRRQREVVREAGHLQER
jgi:hypothetical protein